MKVLSWRAQDNDAFLYIREGDKNLGPLVLQLPTVFTSKPNDPKVSLESLVTSLALAHDKASAQRFLDEYKAAYDDSWKARSLQTYVDRAGQKTSIDVDIKGLGTDEIFHLYVDKGFRDEFNQVRKKLGFINREPVSPTEYKRNMFDQTKHYKLPERWKSLLEKQRQIHDNLREIGDSIILPFDLYVREAQENYVRSALRLEKDVDNLITEMTFSGLEGYKEAMELTPKVYDAIRTGDFSEVPDIADRITLFRERYVRNESLYREISKRKGIRTRFVNGFEKDPGTPKKNHLETILKKSKAAWKSVERYIPDRFWTHYAKIRDRFGRDHYRTQEKFWKDANSKGGGLWRAGLLSVPDSVRRLYHETMQIYSQLQEEAMSLGGNAGIDLKDMRCIIRLPNSPMDLEQEDSRVDDVITTADIETIGYPNSNYDPDGISQQVVLNAVSTRRTSDGKLRNTTVSYVPSRSMESPLTGDWLSFVHADGPELVVRRSSGIMRYNDGLEPTMIGGYNCDGFDWAKLSNPHREEGLSKKLFLDKRLEKLMKEDTGMFRGFTDNSGFRYESGIHNYKENFESAVPSLDLMKFMKTYYSLLMLDQKLDSAGRTIDFWSDLGLGFDKTVGSYKEYEDAVIYGDGDKVFKYGSTDNEALRRMLEYIIPLLEEHEQMLRIPLRRTLRSRMAVAEEFWNKHWFEHGTVRSVFQKDTAKSFRPEHNKRRLLSMAGLEAEKYGEHQDVYMYLNPVFTGAGQPLIDQFPELDHLRKKLYQEDDVIHKIFRHSILDNIVASAFAESQKVAHPKSVEDKIEGSHFEDVYRVDAINLREHLVKKAGEYAEALKNNGVVAWDGDISFVRERSADLEDLGFVPIGDVNVIKTGKHSFIIKYKRKGKTSVGTKNASVPGYKIIHSPDYVKHGFTPNFMKHAIYHLANSDDSWKERLHRIASLTKDIREGNLGIEDYLMTIMPRHSLETYSKQFFGSKRGLISVSEGMEKDKKYTVVMEEGDDDTVRFSEYRQDGEYQPWHTPYLMMMWEPQSTFSKTFYGMVMPAFPEHTHRDVKSIMQNEIEPGRWDEHTFRKLEMLRNSEPPIERKPVKNNQISLF